jgi:hypothetical protein
MGQQVDLDSITIEGRPRYGCNRVVRSVYTLNRDSRRQPTILGIDSTDRNDDGASRGGAARSLIRLTLLASILCLPAATALTACGEENGPPAEDRSCQRYCVTVAPKRGNTKTVFTFRGHDWLPRRLVRAVYGVYCPRGAVCILIAKTTRFRTDERGRFMFRFRNGPEPLTGVPRPRASGGGPVTFEQWTGRPGQSRRISRSPTYAVDGRVFAEQSVRQSVLLAGNVVPGSQPFGRDLG